MITRASSSSSSSSFECSGDFWMPSFDYLVSVAHGSLSSLATHFSDMLSVKKVPASSAQFHMTSYRFHAVTAC
eukprot:1872786-Amphidinium_carterae.1